jgi:hypothetical protein
MPKSNPRLITALRETAQRLEQGARYEWGHMARCNCGHLVQTLTGMSDAEIARSVNFQLDEWSEYANDYCEGSQHQVEDLFVILQDVGFSRADVIHLENLSDKQVLNRLGEEGRYLRRNCRGDVTLYLNTLADMLELE